MSLLVGNLEVESPGELYGWCIRPRRRLLSSGDGRVWMRIRTAIDQPLALPGFLPKSDVTSLTFVIVNRPPCSLPVPEMVTGVPQW